MKDRQAVVGQYYIGTNEFVHEFREKSYNDRCTGGPPVAAVFGSLAGIPAKTKQLGRP